MANYNESEFLICLAAKLMSDRTTAFVGTGIPMLAAALAKRTHAPDLVSVFEFGGTGASLEKLPLGVADSRTFHRAVAASGICDIMETAQRGFIEYGFLGGAQIDAYGNLNTTVIGPYWPPKVRLPGSGGANEVGSFCWKTIIIMRQHDHKRFLPKIDFLTTPGYLTGPGAREAAGLPSGTGPFRVVTNLALMDFEPESKRMRLIAVHPGVTAEQVVAATGFELLVADEVGVNPEPTDKELKLLREEIDPDHYYI
ncbi:MAG TPA: 3-oxoacid CoA-transferase [candidate division WOR-3 bacterium]|uniref:3-oxoacid CoA-transferase n=1 Tax=candidate division WOR-3 bacterium TaxID=2052148 RepID=A0A7V0XFB1_UNCW3|nr:3-oxoacid CoA-transferase [candidate division WOR-3 bacterium]